MGQSGTKKAVAVIGWNGKKSYTEIWNQVEDAIRSFSGDSADYDVELFTIDCALPELTVEGMAAKWGEFINSAKTGRYIAVIAVGEHVHVCLNKVLSEAAAKERFTNLDIPLLYTVGGSQSIELQNENAFLCWGPSAGDMAQYAAYYARRHNYENVLVLACVPKRDQDYAQSSLLAFKEQYPGKITERVIEDQDCIVQSGDCAKYDFVYVTGIGDIYAMQVKCLEGLVTAEVDTQGRGSPDVLTDHSVLGLGNLAEIKIRYVGLGVKNIVSFFVKETLDVICKAEEIRDGRTISLVDVIRTMSDFDSVHGDIPFSFTGKREIKTPVFLCGAAGRISDESLEQDVFCSMRPLVSETDVAYLLKVLDANTFKWSKEAERDFEVLWNSKCAIIETFLHDWVSIFKLKGMGLVVDTRCGSGFSSTYASEQQAETDCFSIYRHLRSLGFDQDSLQVNLSGGDLGDTDIARLRVFRIVFNSQSEDVKETGFFNIADYPQTMRNVPSGVLCDGNVVVNALIADNPCSDQPRVFSHTRFDGDRCPSLFSQPVPECCNSCMMVEGDPTYKTFEQLVSDIIQRSDGANFVYVVRPYKERMKGQDYALMARSVRKLSSFELTLLSTLSEKVLSGIRGILDRGDVLHFSTRTAIGSIMSRNGSHNIGSHVLAALSHNVGTMPDDRVLYQYIQHRMDYIATVTTDFPTWTQPTMLLGGLMKTFLSQRHLLDHITESEGLSAWQYQGRRLLEADRADQHWIEFHVRKKIKDTGEYKDLIHYDEGTGERGDETGGEGGRKCRNYVDLSEDVALAIPGGTVGQHAFYTILENILRNAAKHDWSLLDKTERSRLRNLPIYIDFEDSVNHEAVEFCVWTKVRRLENAAEMLDVHVRNWLEKLESVSELTEKEREDIAALPVNQRQQVLIERRFIDANGGLRRENWGLAEMKISAGYLQRRDVGDIGGLNSEKYCRNRAIVVPSVHVEKDECYLAYRFNIAKPRELLCIVDDAELKGVSQDRLQKAKDVGVFFKALSEVRGEKDTAGNQKEKSLNYRFVVHPSLSLDALKSQGVKYPFRVISGAKISDVRLDDPERGLLVGLLEKMIPVWDRYGVLVDKALRSDQDVATASRRLLMEVYRVWSDFLIVQHPLLGKDKKVGLLVAPTESKGKGGSSLISDRDVLNYVLGECFETCVHQYCKIVPIAVSRDDNGASVLSVLSQLAKSVRSLPERSSVGFGMAGQIANQLYVWLGSLVQGDEVVGMRQHLKRKYRLTDRTSRKDAKVDGRNMSVCSGGSKGLSVHSYSQLEIEARRVEGLLALHPIDGFIQYVLTVHAQTKSLFKQYEENIASLPDGFIVPNEKSRVAKSGTEDGLGRLPFEIVGNVKSTEADDRKWIAYRRHDYSLKGERFLYAEPLSGTQSYLSQLMRLPSDNPIADAGIYVRLLENGLMRLLVIDERVAKFVREHETEVASIYQAMGIFVVDDKRIEGDDDREGKVAGLCFESCFKKGTKDALSAFVSRDEIEIKEGEKELLQFRSKYEILIVHQGILDKWFAHFKSDSTKMSRLLQAFKQMFKYVVITTGRGTPTNIPPDAHLVPFAVVEAALFRKFPEKMLLVDTVMNVLAVGKHNDGGAQ